MSVARPQSLSASVSDAELDRLSELANIGAGHAATAFAQLAGRPMWMRVPRVRAANPSSDPQPQLESDPELEMMPDPALRSGVFFELEGDMRGRVALLFRADQCEAILQRLRAERSDAGAALTELGNILVSQMASAIADTLGARLIPSIPTLVLEGTEQELEAALVQGGTRTGEPPPADPIRIECELTDGREELGGLLVFVPEA